MSKTIITADLHCSDNPRDAYRFEFFKTLRSLINRNHVNHLIILGDLTEQKDRHSAWLVNRVVDELFKLAENCSVTIVRGNHDYIDADNPFFGFLRHVKNITWINKPTGAHDELYLPHTNDYKKDWAGINFHEYRWVFSHQTYTGAKVGPRAFDGIPLSVFANANVHVISGDIHVPQKFGPIIYVGSPYLVDFGDDFTPRVILLDGIKRESIPISGPQKRLVELTAGNLQEINKFTGLYSGDILKVRISILMKHYARWHEYKSWIQKWGEDNGFQIYSVIPVITNHKVDIGVTVKEHDIKTDLQLLTSYSKQRGIDEQTFHIGKTLMN